MDKQKLVYHLNLAQKYYFELHFLYQPAHRHAHWNAFAYHYCCALESLNEFRVMVAQTSSPIKLHALFMEYGSTICSSILALFKFGSHDKLSFNQSILRCVSMPQQTPFIEFQKFQHYFRHFMYLYNRALETDAYGVFPIVSILLTHNSTLLRCYEAFGYRPPSPIDMHGNSYLHLAAYRGDIAILNLYPISLALAHTQNRLKQSPYSIALSMQHQGSQRQLFLKTFNHTLKQLKTAPTQGPTVLKLPFANTAPPPQAESSLLPTVQPPLKPLLNPYFKHFSSMVFPVVEQEHRNKTTLTAKL